MSKSVELQVEKTRNLVEGLRKHLSAGKGGISVPAVETMEREVQALVEASVECERLRSELGPKVKRMNDILARVKAAYTENKMVIKNHYTQEEWAAYGVPDKR